MLELDDCQQEEAIAAAMKVAANRLRGVPIQDIEDTAAGVVVNALAATNRASFYGGPLGLIKIITTGTAREASTFRTRREIQVPLEEDLHNGIGFSRPTEDIALENIQVANLFEKIAEFAEKNLTPKQYQAINIFITAKGSLSMQEMATIMGLGENQFKSQLQRAKENIRDRFGDKRRMA